MNVIYLKADSRAALIAALEAVGMWDEQFKPATPGDALDEVGTIYRGTGQFVIMDGEQVELQQPIPGYHANMILHGDVPAEIQAIALPKPNSPSRVFAGL